MKQGGETGRPCVSVCVWEGCGEGKFKQGDQEYPAI